MHITIPPDAPSFVGKLHLVQQINNGSHKQLQSIFWKISQKEKYSINYISSHSDGKFHNLCLQSAIDQNHLELALIVIELFVNKILIKFVD